MLKRYRTTPGLFLKLLPSMWFETPPGDPPPPGTDYEALYRTAQTKIASLEQEHKTRYAGVQQSLQLEKDAHKATKSIVDNLTTKITDAEKEINTFKELETTWTTEKETLSTQLTQKESELGRKSLILEKFPHLANFEAQKLLPAAETIEELETKLTAFSSNIKTIEETSDGKRKQGQVPETPGKTNEVPGKKSDALKIELQGLALAGNQKDYDAKYAEYNAALVEEAKTP